MGAYAGNFWIFAHILSIFNMGYLPQNIL